MPFYLFFSEEPQYVENEIYFLENEFDAKKLAENEYYASNGFRYRLAKNLVDLIFFATFKNSCFSNTDEEFLESCQSEFNDLCIKFKSENIAKAFPKSNFESSKNELTRIFELQIEEINRAIEEQDRWSEIEYQDKLLNKLQDELNDELDNDDEGFWRISNDFG